MPKFFIYLFCLSLFSLCIVQSSFSNESPNSVYEQECTITNIKGAVITTSCKEFSVSEEMKITDITGRPVLIYELPLPCLATIEYICISTHNCSSIISITLLQKIKVVPE